MPKIWIALLLLAMPAVSFAKPPDRLPEFSQQEPRDWLNSRPLTRADLRGKVVLIDFWTFSCWNCYRSFPWLTGLEARIDDPRFTIIGVHSPEFEHERNRVEVRRQADKFGLDHPIMIDNDFAFWRAMNNRYWPTFYLVDQRGRVRHMFIGETHAGEPRALEIENAILALLERDPERR